MNKGGRRTAWVESLNWVWYLQTYVNGVVMAEEEKGFVIRDRRGRGAEGQEAPTSEQAATAQSQEAPARKESVFLKVLAMPRRSSMSSLFWKPRRRAI